MCRSGAAGGCRVPSAVAPPRETIEAAAVTPPGRVPAPLLLPAALQLFPFKTLSPFELTMRLNLWREMF